MEIDLRLYAPIATGIGIVVSSTLWYLNWRRKEFAYQVLGQAPVAAINKAVAGRLQMMFDGRPVDDMHVVLVKLINNGSDPIRANDYDGPLAVVCGPGTQVIMAEVEETNPADLAHRSVEGINPKALIEAVQGNRAVLRPVLLNRGDWITLKLLVSGAEPSVLVSAHIEGIPSVKQMKESTIGALVIGNVGVLMMALALFLADIPELLKNDWADYVPTAILFLVGYTVVMLAFLRAPKPYSGWHPSLSVPHEVLLCSHEHEAVKPAVIETEC